MHIIDHNTIIKKEKNKKFYSILFLLASIMACFLFSILNRKTYEIDLHVSLNYGNLFYYNESPILSYEKIENYSTDLFVYKNNTFIYDEIRSVKISPSFKNLTTIYIDPQFYSIEFKTTNNFEDKRKIIKEINNFFLYKNIEFVECIQQSINADIYINTVKEVPTFVVFSPLIYKTTVKNKKTNKEFDINLVCVKNNKIQGVFKLVEDKNMTLK